MKKILKEFKEFISRGSVVDLAVGVIVGGAFSKIVTSLVNDLLMPLIGIIIGGLFYAIDKTFKVFFFHNKKLLSNIKVKSPSSFEPGP